MSPKGFTRHTWWSPGSLLAGDGAPEQLARPSLKSAYEALGATAGLTAAAVREARTGELIVGHWLVPCGLAAVTAARLNRGRAHLIAHGSDVALLESLPGGRALARLLDAGAAGITFVSGNLRARFGRLCGWSPRARWAVLPMGVHPPRPDLPFAAALLRQAAGRPIIATVGRLSPIKGLETLAAALAELDDVLWLCAGDGPLRGRLEGATHLGRLNVVQRDALLSCCAVFVLPSEPVGGRQEGTPLSVLEALRAGAPTVATRIGGVPSVAGPAGALLVSPHDPEALRAALLTALEPSKNRQMRAAHRRFARRFDWECLGPAHRAALAD